MGSCHTDTGKFRGHTGIVSGPPERFRGSTLRGQPSRRASWTRRGREPAPGGLGAPPSLGPMRLGLGGNPSGCAPLAWGASPPPLAAAPLEIHLQGCAPPLGGLYKGGRGRAAAP